MKTLRRWSPDMCFYCRLLDMRSLPGGGVVFWCGQRKGAIPDSFIWKRNCRGFIPMRTPKMVTGQCGTCPVGAKGVEQPALTNSRILRTFPPT